MEHEDEPSGVFSPATTDVIPAEERAQTIAGRYRIEERIGSGGMGQVLRVSHRRLGKAFALKLMQAELSIDPESRAIFHREARLASSLTHPNIVSIVDFGEDPDWGLFLVMEYLEGDSLADRIDNQGKLPILVVCDVAVQLAEALHCSHSKQVVHADLKADNVLLVEDPNYQRRRWNVKLLDFGMAHLATAAGGRDDQIAGTPEYLAPERITGGKPQPSVDIYALGIVLYEMLTGAVPFSGSDPRHVLHRHLKEPLPPVADRRGEPLDEKLVAIVEGCLRKDPAERYPSMRAVSDDLRAYMHDLGLRRRTAGFRAVSELGRSEVAECALDALPLPVAGLRANGTIVVANPSFARLVRRELAEVEGLSILETAIANVHPDLRDDLRLVAMDGNIVRRTILIRKSDGQDSAMRLQMTPSQGDAGDCMLVLHPLAAVHK